MNEFARQQLCAMVASQGPGVVEDPRRVRGLLGDLCPGLKREVHVLATALEQGVVRELAGSSDAVPWEAVCGRLVRRMTDEMGLAPEAARWAVDAWAEALGKKTAPQQQGDIFETPTQRVDSAQVTETLGQKPAEGPPRSKKRALFLAVVMLLLLGGGGAAGWWFLGRQRAPQDEKPGPAFSAREVEKVLDEDIAAVERALGQNRGTEGPVRKVAERRLALWQHAAEGGERRGQYLYGRALELGAGVGKDEAEAAKWYRRSAEQGYRFAQNDLGALYAEGRGVGKDDARAVEWFRKAAEQGLAAAQVGLGGQYEHGKGVAGDPAHAVRWYRLAAEQGNALGQARLGSMYAVGKGVTRADNEAVKWFRKSAEAGNAVGQYSLGQMYLEGRGVARDDAQAGRWFRACAEQGHADGQYRVGRMSELGQGVRQDLRLARRWYREAAARGVPGAKRAVARLDRRLAGNALVVLVGIGKYRDERIKPRQHAEKDARALYDLFTDKDYLGADRKRVRLLLGSADAKRGARRATRANILGALRWLTAEARRGDLVIFAFIGQGGFLGESGERRCYFASDSTVQNRGKNAVAAGEIEVALAGLRSRRFCAFLDVDFTGFRGAPATPTLGKAPYKELLGADASLSLPGLPGRALFLATNGLVPSLDLTEHGVFTRVLLDGLRGGADSQGYEPDGAVTVDELGGYLRSELPSRARMFGKTAREKKQYPFALGSRAGHFVLTRNPKVAPAVQARLVKLDDLLDEGKFPARYAEEGRSMLERMPRLWRRQDVRKLYQQLIDGKLALAAFESKHQAALAGMKLPPSTAARFARTVVEASRIVKGAYVRPLRQGDLVERAVRAVYDRAEEMPAPDVEARLAKAGGLDEAGLTALARDARLALGVREDLYWSTDLNVALGGMLRDLDPYTTYIDPDAHRRAVPARATFTGLGIRQGKDDATGHLLVVTPIYDSPAYKAGLQAGDLITEIIREQDGEGKALKKPETTRTRFLSQTGLARLLQGKAGSKVKLKVQRKGKAEPFVVEIARGPIEVESVLGAYRKGDDRWEFLLDRTNKIGYVRFLDFNGDTARDLERVVRELAAGGMKGLVLDLRFTRGELLESVAQVAEMLLEGGKIVTIRSRGGKADKTVFARGKGNKALRAIPMVCLVNGYSAGAGEMVAAALQDHHRAYVIGERSSGQGSVQKGHPLRTEYGEAELRLTTATLWRPSGKNLAKQNTRGRDRDVWGVIPDRVVKLSAREVQARADHMNEVEIIERPDRRAAARTSAVTSLGKDRQLQAALRYLGGMIRLSARGRENKGGKRPKDR
jgi:C-terminal peptidase prc